MNTITRTALANLKQNKSRNILSGIAILLTTLLIFLILTVGYDSITVRFAGVNAYYASTPTIPPTMSCSVRYPRKTPTI